MNDHDELGTQLTRTLTEHSDVMAGTSLGLADVKGRARSIRRRRTATAVVGVAAAVAVIVPTVSLATHTNGRPEPAPAVTQSPSPTQSVTVDGHQPKPGVLDVSDLPTGDSPAMEYVTDGRVLHQVDGSTVDIPTQKPVSAFVVLTDGTHVWQTADDQGNVTVEIEAADGTVHDPAPSTHGLSVSRSHDAAAWVQPDGQVMVFTVGAADARTLGDPVPAGAGVRVGPFGSDDCIQDYCSVFVNVQGGNSPGQPWEVADFATRPFTDGRMITVADTSGGVFTGYTQLDEQQTCSDLWGGGEFQGFQTCDHTLVSFSPDGSLVLADPDIHSGIGNGLIGMYALHGKLLWERHSTEKAQAFYPEAQWEDGTHVLAPVFQDGRWSVVRFTSEGSMEYAVSPVPGQDVENPFVLATGGPVLGD